MITKKDYLIGAVAGFFTGALLLTVLFFLKFSFPYQTIVMLIVIPIFWALGVGLGGFLGKYIPFLTQFGKYAAAGFLSAAIDFAVLNYISYLTGITAGVVVGWINIPGFSVAVINGYLWNKLWVFKALGRDTRGLLSDFPKFAIVAIGGLILNSALIIMITTYIPMPFGLDSTRWLNIAKVVASIAVIIWNFLGFKFIVFRK